MQSSRRDCTAPLTAFSESKFLSIGLCGVHCLILVKQKWTDFSKVFLERKGLSEDKIHQLPRHPVAVYFKSPRAARRSQRCQSPFPVDKDGASGPLWRSPCLSAGATDYGAILKPNPRFVTPLFFFRLLLFVTIGWRPFWNAGVRVAAFIMINLSDGPRTFSLSLALHLFVLLDPTPRPRIPPACRTMVPESQGMPGM